MKLNQLELLSKLNDVLIELAQECEKDDKFNDTIANMNIFKRDIMECSDSIFDKLEEE